TLFRLLKLLPLHSASSDTKLEQAIRFMLDHERNKGEWVVLGVVGRTTRGSIRTVPTVQPVEEAPLLDLSWIPVGWWRLVTDLPTRDLVPQRVNRRHFEACVTSQILAALNSGDLY